MLEKFCFGFKGKEDIAIRCKGCSSHLSLINITCDQLFHHIIIIADSKSGIGYAIYGIWNLHGKCKYDPRLESLAI